MKNIGFWTGNDFILILIAAKILSNGTVNEYADAV